ncbi:RNA polymerase sigma-70 factor [Leifsonia sp. Le1]|uniref:RNA polymerase sigma-70 factor n=1 Tax=Leifsonia sp. Le1 TaxID=3404918 RepID=UPI003EB93A81
MSDDEVEDADREDGPEGDASGDEWSDASGDEPGDASGDATEFFVAHRNLLFTVAYEMLGSAADAEDVLQETWLRWVRVDRAEVRNERAYLVRIATRLALNRLRSVQRRREAYVGPWLPEPLLTAPDVADDAELAESVSMALMVVLETLGPTERVVFVLREVFGFGFDEIAAAVDRTPAAVRQIAHRARGHVEARRPRVTVTAGEARAALEAFRVAVETGDTQGVLAVLAPDVVLVSDGGGVKQAALRPIVGADKVARFIAGGIRKTGASVTGAATTVNGNPALVLSVDGEMDGVLAAQVADGRIVGLYFVRNPQKLTRVGEETMLSRR